MMVDGSTRVFGVLGDPIAQVQAPRLLNTLFAELGRNAVLVPMHVRPDQLAETVAGLRRIVNLDGLLVTVPHKVAVCGLADRVSPTVAAAGSANALRREPDGSWLAENFDGTGFVAGLRHAGHEPAGRSVTLVGAGGAGAAIAVALLDAGVGRLAVHDVDADRREDLVDRLERHRPGIAVATAGPALGDADIAVNATPLGLREDDPLPFAPESLRPGGLVADIIMKPADTALLRAASALGYPIHYGRHMLEGQLDGYRRFFRLDAVTVH
ncbi:shikimate dehydrogenase family protein [Dactylosporangium sp. CA-139114]|uniref:shikimate dehydrogenase family protein n=1 Tax=Dactylosporangium sp. CA-139114 TaxID=3239931 RepID=UPI003D971C81